MSAWSDNPEWFDNFFFERALSGKYGTVAQSIAELQGEFGYYALEKLDEELAFREACEAIERQLAERNAE